MAVDEFGREVPAPHSPRPRSYSYGSPDRRNRSVSPSPAHRRRRRRESGDNHKKRPPSSISNSSKHHHPSERYAKDPLLCRYVWEQRLLLEQEKEEPKDEEGDTAMESNDNAETAPATTTVKPLFSSPEEATQAYNLYNTKYCTLYIRSFFNAHLDDPWFRLRLSPLIRYRQSQTERHRSNLEAIEFAKEIKHSLEEESLGVIPKKDPDCPDYLKAPKCSFVSGCRLSVGTKESGYGQVLMGEDRNRIERHAKCHLHSFVRGDAAVKILDVPEFVGEEMIAIALARFGDKKDITLYSGPVSIPTTKNDRSLPYHRDVYVVFPSREKKEDVLDRLRRDQDGGRSRRDRMPRHLELEVDCTDVYGRKEVDHDNFGGAPPGKKEADSRLPSKVCRVMVATSSLAPTQHVSVLTAAVSTRGRIQNDRSTATQIAQGLDNLREISQGHRLTDLLKLLYPTPTEWESVDDEDILDVSIAYLRRVHLFSFYNGCVMAEQVGSVLAYNHPAGTIHLRLRNADDILRNMAEEKGGDSEADVESFVENTVKNDMLVMRLNESIEKALEGLNTRSEIGSSCLIDVETDAAAKEIEKAEMETKNTWLQNHGTIDEDGRARCSFHWCKKLFKDKAFLQKHLLKKHSDHLRAECAKCHDQAMMAAWDKIEHRPVPPILIDCGAKFRKVPSSVIGSTEPLAHDPEPQLWKEEEERMAEEERRRKEAEEEERLAEEERAREEQRRMDAMAGEKRKGNFVDVDDMVEEKVELKMEDVVVAPPPKKKKKKKSLL